MSFTDDRKSVSCAIKPRVTLGVCARNSEDFIKETIESILVQDYPHELMELVFVDDGSEDNTLSIIKEYASRIDIKTKVFHTSWEGLGHARNIVVFNADGDFILWVDSDMIISRDFVRKLVRFMDQHCEAGIAKGKHGFEPEANLLGTLETYSRAANSGIANYEFGKTHSKALGTGGAIYRIVPLRRAGGFDENLKGYCEDWDLEIRIRNAGWSMWAVDAKYLDYERHGLTWRSLWNRYWRRGYFTHHFLHKRKGLIKHYRWFPPAAFFLGLVHADKLFKLCHEKKVFLLPFQYAFKMTAFYFGFFKSHLNSYQPS
jgi:glycosyltransferase involved in cell wall biosynthesis